ncbi:MAG: hypothetical protein GY792_28220, partial [Gammaproteobacteria bacterium]|nr:hypothetical protein [Gammaproteobacteria bacterium]
MFQHFRNLLGSDEIEGKVVYVLGIVLLVQFFYPITETGSLVFLLIYQVVYASLILAGIIITRNNPRLVRLLYALGTILVVAGAIYAFNQDAVWANLTGYAAYIVFDVIIIWILFKYVFETRIITRDVLYAAVAIYLLLGAVFVPAYGLVDTLTFELSDGTLHAFVGGSTGADELFAWQDFIYFSYVTLTTLGYGDILPTTMVAKAAVAFEAIIGVMYLTIIMARLVSLYSADFN